MKCTKCGAEISDIYSVCPRCKSEIRIVPDYDPLDDVMTEQVRGSLNQTFELGDESDQSKKVERSPQISERERRCRIMERRRMIAKRRRQRLLIILGIAVALITTVSVIAYKNSYVGRVNKGNKLFSEGQYNEAITYYQKAIDKNSKKREAYDGMASVYINQKELEKAEKMFNTAIKEHPDATEIYESAIKFYVGTKQEKKVSLLLSSCKEEAVLEDLNEYISIEPEFLLDSTKVYDDIQALELECKDGVIYYTNNGEEPTKASTKYTGPIKLQEGETEIKAITVNKKGIPSLTVSKVYTVEFPMEDAPAVTPTTGQYDSAQKITINVPEHYVGYYTTDGSMPDPASNTTYKYTGPINMPEGNTIFTAVLVDQNGRISDTTKRNYELLYSNVQE